MSPDIFVKRPEVFSDTPLRVLSSTIDDGDLGPSHSDERDKYLKANRINSDKVFYMEQVHGGNVSLINKDTLANKLHVLSGADSLITQEKDIYLGVVVADCAPILVYNPDQDKPLVAAIHAGWRGLDARVVFKTMLAIEKLGADPAKSKVWIGSHICTNCFEFGKTEATRFLSYDGAVRRHNGDLTKVLLNLDNIIIGQLKEFGVPDESISIDNRCTKEDQDLFSYRRDKTSDRNLYLIGLNI